MKKPASSIGALIPVIIWGVVEVAKMVVGLVKPAPPTEDPHKKPDE